MSLTAGDTVVNEGVERGMHICHMYVPGRTKCEEEKSSRVGPSGVMGSDANTDRGSKRAADEIHDR